ncbi:MAG: hypothetical protein AUG07_00995 [Acidobacteria bacterium 13_1_20CM_2_60_10]|nr:MAG: hypothetical protein AUG07_00995 [Acidobacteria bacterium 13_1_20CM_2_60_10]
MARKAAESEIAVKPKAEPSLATRIGFCVAAWMVPGLGHLLLGRRWRALILFCSILAMFFLGLAMEGEFFSRQSDSYLQTLGYFGELCVGLAMPTAGFFGYSGGDPFFVSSDYGTAFLVTAGMLNALTILDVYDIALGRKP